MRTKPKFNKRKCAKCKYHGNCGAGYVVKINGVTRNIICNYSGVTRNTCLVRDGKNVIDKRGDDFDHCKLYEKGPVQHESSAYGGIY
jgi:hypothetical protein